MIVVKTVNDFARKNEQALKSFMIYKTGIRDENIIQDTIQDFYVKLIESQALDKFDSGVVKYGDVEDCFNAYICTLFSWILPALAKKNFRARYDVVSTVKTRNSRVVYFDYPVDVWDYTTTDNLSSPYIGFNVDPHYGSSHAYVDEEYATQTVFEDFKKYVIETEKPKKAKRIVALLDHRAAGCTSKDVAHILGLSGNMIKMIKNKTQEKFNKWSDRKGLLTVSGNKKRKEITYADVVAEIQEVQDLIKRRNRGDISLPSGFSYKDAILRLQYLRNRQRMLKKRQKRDQDHSED